MKLRAVIGALALVAAMSGCIARTKETLTVFPDGSGKLEVWSKGGRFVFGDVKDGPARDDLHEELARWKGVVAWSDLSSKVVGCEVELSATAWFTDLNAVAHSGDPRDTFSWTETAPGVHRLRWERPGLADVKVDAEPGKPALDISPEKIDAIMTLFDDLSVRVVVLPGKISSSEGCKEVSGCRATAMLFPPRVRDVVKQAIAYEEQVKAGKLTREAAEKELRAKLGSRLDDAATIEASCRDEDVRRELDAHRRAFESARKAWEGSADERAVGEARKSLAEMKKWM